MLPRLLFPSYNGFILTKHDLLWLIRAVAKGRILPVTDRPSQHDLQHHIYHGDVFVIAVGSTRRRASTPGQRQRRRLRLGANGRTEMQRWIDHKVWSSSRTVGGGFLQYEEKPKDPSDPPFVKRTISRTIDGVTYRVICYILMGRECLLTPTTDPTFAGGHFNYDRPSPSLIFPSITPMSWYTGYDFQAPSAALPAPLPQVTPPPPVLLAPWQVIGYRNTSETPSPAAIRPYQARALPFFPPPACVATSSTNRVTGEEASLVPFLYSRELYPGYMPPYSLVPPTTDIGETPSASPSNPMEQVLGTAPLLAQPHPEQPAWALSAPGVASAASAVPQWVGAYGLTPTDPVFGNLRLSKTNAWNWFGEGSAQTADELEELEHLPVPFYTF